ncbi:PTS mannose/fructose/sorbose/N-acetylgalactosamine transporter subunit IIC [Tepidanaerobacter syntrophicus]|uniref:PTS mannose/fructose/sorbose/N-acetylgalactosamine transporter subunit IIC n=1 Tax=Tepidanaerobacter syntrophicus TaxID=224999 RepID=UPI001BD24685|nr:PTS sugar transporter subunit IIC [Tepidanaerobacter syntrophicus]
MIQAFLVSLTVFVLEYVDVWFSFPMTARPLIVGTAIGIVLGDIKTGIIVGANLELVFMGVMAIGGTVPPDAVTGTAVGTAFAIILGHGTETAFALAIPASILSQSLFVPLVALRSLWSPVIDRMVDNGDYKGLQRMMPIVTATALMPKSLVSGIAVALGSATVEKIIDKMPQVFLDGMGIAAGMLAAVGFALLLKMMWTKKLAVYFFVGFILSSYLKLPLMAIAILGVLYVIILYVEGNKTSLAAAGASSSGEEELFND